MANQLWQQLAEEFPNNLAFVDCARHERLCRKEQVRSLPTMTIYKPGLPAWTYGSGQSLEDYQKFLRAVIHGVDSDKKDYYAILGVDRDASQAQIRKNYRKLSLRWHPDKHSGDEEARKKFQAISEAYEMLGDADKRALSDSSGGFTFHSRHDMEMALMYGLVSEIKGFYEEDGPVEPMSWSTFFEKVGRGCWMVEFYAPWCGHCQEMVPAFKKSAAALDGECSFGAVNCDDHSDLCNRMRVRSYPSIKFFMVQKGIDAEVYEGEHTVDAIVKYVRRQKDPLTVKLSAKNFEERALKSRELWILAFSAGSWCGPCQQLTPTLRDLASEVKGVAKVGIVNCDNNNPICPQFGIEGYPSVLMVPRGPKGNTVEEMASKASPLFEESGGGMMRMLDTSSAVEIFGKVARAALGWRECFDREAFKDALSSYYEEHAPGQAEKVSEILVKYEGDEEMLVRKLEAKYKVKFPWDFKAGSAIEDDEDANEL